MSDHNSTEFKRRQFTGFKDILPLPEMEGKTGEGFHYKGVNFITHSLLSFEDTAFFRTTNSQQYLMIGFVMLIIFSLILNWHTTVVVLITLLTTIYFFDLLFNLFMIMRTFYKNPEITFSPQELEFAREWPTYSIFCPLYKEWQVIPQFVQAIAALDYPKDKLQVLLLLEQDDYQTIQKVYDYELPAYFQIIVVPHSMPKTKPKACNFGLKFARGEYSVIFDAEDIPQADQLKKAVLAFEKLPLNVACVQAKLNFYNPHQNLLTKLFTSEYSLWFDLVLTGLQSINAPIPLGGTSNHFKTVVLRLLGGWDAFNVTEDCDLGLRLTKRGFQTAIIDSTTHEEANSDVKNWFWQRSRWIKGYMQSYLVHTRDVKDFLKVGQRSKFFAFQSVVGGRIFALFVNPLMWSLTLFYFLDRPVAEPIIKSFYLTPVLYMGVFCLVFGNFLYLYYYMIGCAKRGYYELIPYSFIVPFYWLFMSGAAWLALYKLITAPHHWSKTVHGLHLQQAQRDQEKNDNSIHDIFPNRVGIYS